MKFDHLKINQEEIIHSVYIAVKHLSHGLPLSQDVPRDKKQENQIMPFKIINIIETCENDKIENFSEEQKSMYISFLDEYLSSNLILKHKFNNDIAQSILDSVRNIDIPLS